MFQTKFISIQYITLIGWLINYDQTLTKNCNQFMDLINYLTYYEYIYFL
jgi:hypothetical protein